MLQHEQTDPPTVSPTIPLPVPNAADARVTPDELNAALKALEDRQSSTVAIGSVVDELHLNATPEQIWEQVQAQRQQVQAAQTPPAQSYTATPKTRPRRRGRWYVLFAVVCVAYGFSHNGYVAMYGGEAQAPFDAVQTITITGDSQTETIPVQGKDVVISGEDNKITLQGRPNSVTVSGEENTVRGDIPKEFASTGEDNNVQWTGGEPHPVAPRPPSP